MATHVFASKTYRSLTSCDVCNKVLWGISKQGVSCLYCATNVHKKCQTLAASRPCVHRHVRRHSMDDLQQENIVVSSQTEAEISSDRLTVDETENQENIDANSKTLGAMDGNLHAHKMPTPPAFVSTTNLAHLPPPIVTSPLPMSFKNSAAVASAASVSPSVAPSRSWSIRRRRRSVADAGKADNLDLKGDENSSAAGISLSSLPGVGVIRDWIQTAAEKAADLESSRQPPRLNLFTTLPKNFTRFIMKAGPAADLQDKIERILHWETPTETGLLMIVYVLICFYPSLLLFVPHAVLLIILANNYFAKIRKETKNNSASADSGYLSSDDGKKREKSRVRSKSRDRATKTKGSTTSAAAQKSFYPEQIDYKRNMQFIQNTMGLYCDVYDNLRVMNTHLDWNDEEHTGMILKLTIFSSIALMLTYWLVPWSWVFATGGVCVFVANTTFGRASQAVLSRYIETKVKNVTLKSTISSLLTFLHSSPPEPRGRSHSSHDRHFSHAPPKSTKILVECVENQRYWAGLGWLPHLLRSERAPWSNLTGSTPVHPYPSYSTPTQLITAGLAFSSRSSHQPLGSSLGVLQWSWQGDWEMDREWEKTDEEGWVYSDHRWSTYGVVKKNVMTRRRRWVRWAVLEGQVKEE